METTNTRKLPVEFMKSTLISGAFVILPLGLVATIVLRIVSMLEPLRRQLSSGCRTV